MGDSKAPNTFVEYCIFCGVLRFILFLLRIIGIYHLKYPIYPFVGCLVTRADQKVSDLIFLREDDLG